jgi:hypothetical protein
MIQFSFGQESNTWIRSFDFEVNVVAEIKISADNGYLIYGINGFKGVDTTVISFLIKVDHTGDLVWEKSTIVHGNVGFGPYSSAMRPTDDDGYFLVSSTNAHDPEEGEMILYKFDSELNTIWLKEYHNIGFALHSAHQTNDGGYIMCGATCVCTFSRGTYFTKVMKTDNYGEVLWTKEDSSGSSYDNVLQVAEGGYIIYGDTLLVRTDSVGNTVWTHSFENCAFGEGLPAIQASDNGFVVVVQPYDVDYAPNEIWIQKFDESGNLLWSKEYGTENPLSTTGGIKQTKDGGLVIVATSRAEETYLWLLKTDEVGDTIWTRSLNYYDGFEGMDIKQTPDGGYIILARAYFDDHHTILLIKTEANGNVLQTPVEEKYFEPLIKLYPNPTYDILNISIETGSPESIEVTSACGQQLLHRAIEGTTHQLDLSFFQKGIYFITIRSKGFVTTRKIIKM